MLRYIRHLIQRIRGTPRVIVLPSAPKELDRRTREELRAWLVNPTTQLAFALAELRKPSLIISGSGVAVQSEFDERALINRAHQIQGWEDHVSKIMAIVDDEAPLDPLEENYPNE